MNKHEMPATVGGSCMLTVLAVICLVVFAVLGVSTVQADGRLSNAQAQSVKAYYEADARAQEILSLIREGDTAQGVYKNQDIYRYECAISETQILEVEVRVNGGNYEILKWQVVSSADWNTEENLNLLNSENKQ